MFGSLRLLLALLVALGHLPNSPLHSHGIAWGVTAAVMFYLLSGYAMTALLETHYAGWKKIPRFYLDRALRIGPHYYVLLVVTLAWWFLSGQPRFFFISNENPGLKGYVDNLLIVPLNYFMFNGSWRFSLIPPAWMLGAEIQFYALLPMLKQFRLRALAFGVALLVMGLAYWGVLDDFVPAGMFVGSDVYGYRLLPGALVFFIAGAYLFEAQRRGRRWSLGCLALVSLVLAVAWQLLKIHGRLQQPYVRECMLGILFGWYSIAWLSGLGRRHWDEVLGHLSYGVYLNHFLVQWTVLKLFDRLVVPASGIHEVIRIGIYYCASLAFAYLGWRFIDAPVMQWRRTMRIRLSGADQLAGDQPQGAGLMGSETVKPL